MNRRVLFSIFIFLLLVAVGDAQETGKLHQLIVPLASEGFVGFKLETVETSARGTSAGSSGIQAAVNPQASLDADNVIHRTLVDGAGNFIFGYDLVIIPVPFSRQFRVAVRPLSPEYERQLRARSAVMKQGAQGGLSLATLPRPAEAQLIDDGDAFALDLLVNSQTGVKIVDVVKVSFDRAKLWEVQLNTGARDFTVDSVELSVKDYELLMNGERIGGGKPTHGATGPLVWLYIPYQGRFIFSLTPREGYNFQKVGVVEDNKISFILGGNRYEWISSAPVVGRGGDWNLWVLLDADYVPQYFPSARDSADDREREKESRFKINSMTSSRFPTIASKAVPELKIDVDAQSKLDAQNKKDESGQLRLRPRVMIGSADRMENLLPKK
ncbi:MAG TPA: hypothetical protein VNA19_06485 [Pyrinomonadaceae bacterium]|jgi:hypothetical protein|nr:hypothetical protein [Pyrinomonadaceae bacterium]